MTTYVVWNYSGTEQKRSTFGLTFQNAVGGQVSVERQYGDGLAQIAAHLAACITPEDDVQTIPAPYRHSDTRLTETRTPLTAENLIELRKMLKTHPK